jgi:hypothetical protein
LTQVEYDLRKAEIRWYCETLMLEGPAPVSEQSLLRAQVRDLCDYATEYLMARFPFLTQEYVEEAKKAAIEEFDQEVESPLLPIFRKAFSEGQLRAVKANWVRLYLRWHFIWRDVRYGGQGDLPNPGDVTTHSHYRFAKRCLTYLPRLFWGADAKPPGYVVDVARRVSAEKAERGRANRPGADAERELAMRTFNQVEQVEEWSFIFTALLETATTREGSHRSPATSPEGGDAYDLTKGR